MSHPQRLINRTMTDRSKSTAVNGKNIENKKQVSKSLDSHGSFSHRDQVQARENTQERHSYAEKNKDETKARSSSQIRPIRDGAIELLLLLNRESRIYRIWTVKRSIDHAITSPRSHAKSMMQDVSDRCQKAAFNPRAL